MQSMYLQATSWDHGAPLLYVSMHAQQAEELTCKKGPLHSLTHDIKSCAQLPITGCTCERLAQCYAMEMQLANALLLQDLSPAW